MASNSQSSSAAFSSNSEHDNEQLPIASSLSISNKISLTTLKTSQSLGNYSTENGILSPVTDLALNLHSLSTNSSFTPKRRISWSSDTPIKPFLFLNELTSDSPLYTDSPTFENRVFRYLKDENSPTKLSDGSTTSAAETFTLRKNSLRRLKSSPNHKINRLSFVEKENVTPSVPVEERISGNDERPKEIGDEEFVSYTLPSTTNRTSPVSALASKRFQYRSRSLVASLSDSQDSGYVGAERRASINSLASISSADSISPATKSEIFPEPLRVAPRSKSKTTGINDEQFQIRRPSNCSLRPTFNDNDNEYEELEDGFIDVFNDNENDDEEFGKRSLAIHNFHDLLTQPIVTSTNSASSSSDESELALPLIRQSIPETETFNLPMNGRIARSFSMKERLEYPLKTSKWMYENEENQLENAESNPSSPNTGVPASRKRIFEGSCEKMPFKRPDPPGDVGFLLESKRRRSVSALVAMRQNTNEYFASPISAGLMSVRPVKKSPIQRSQSMSDVVIDSALQRAATDPNLTGDYTVCNTLPLLRGRHPDLKTISAETLRDVVSGNIRGIERYTVIDCRYPYEFDGGHIQGAKNIYTRENIYNHFLMECVNNAAQSGPSTSKENNLVPASSSGRNVLIFHCEFSSERGPTLYRFLRKKDREVNKDNYPYLYYPEIYLLEGGYKNFFSSHKELCEPQEYLPMNHKDHKQDLSHFRAKSKSWNGDSKARSAVRPGLMF